MINSYAELPTRKLARTEFDVSSLGLGTGSLGADPSANRETDEDRIAVSVLRNAVGLGLNYVDTSPAYRGGASERRVGLALRGGLRDQVVVATKVGTHPARLGDYSATATYWTVEQSRKALETDMST